MVVATICAKLAEIVVKIVEIVAQIAADFGRNAWRLWPGWLEIVVKMVKRKPPPR